MSNKHNGFVFDENEKLEYDWPVTIIKPGDETSYVVSMRFYSKDMDELRELEERAEDEGDMANLAVEVCAGWPQEGEKTIRDGNGKVIEATEENKRKLFSRIYIATAVTKAFFASQGGKKRRKQG